MASRRSIGDVALAEGLMTETQLAEALSADNILSRRRGVLRMARNTL